MIDLCHHVTTTTYLLLFSGGEIILDVESLSDLLRGFALDHIGNGFAAYIQQAFDVQIIGS